jgi:hypothetical protein
MRRIIRWLVLPGVVVLGLMAGIPAAQAAPAHIARADRAAIGSCPAGTHSEFTSDYNFGELYLYSDGLQAVNIVDDATPVTFCQITTSFTDGSFKWFAYQVLDTSECMTVDASGGYSTWDQPCEVGSAAQAYTATDQQGCGSIGGQPYCFWAIGNGYALQHLGNGYALQDVGESGDSPYMAPFYGYASQLWAVIQ